MGKGTRKQMGWAIDEDVFDRTVRAVHKHNELYGPPMAVYGDFAELGLRLMLTVPHTIVHSLLVHRADPALWAKFREKAPDLDHLLLSHLKEIEME